ncbi:MAG: hypothetical protein H0T51_01430 [Pirellulales bacterium]|nr:hypothetical protein [Pirellulales bacterium]
MAVRTATRRFVTGWWCCLALAALPGCRNLDNAQVDVLERELRQQEDYIYELEDYLVSYSEKLRQARMAQCETVSTTTKSGSSTTNAPLREPTIDVDPAERVPLPLNGRNKPDPAPAATSDAPPAAAAVAPPASEAPAAEAPVQAPAEAAEPEAVSPEEMEAPALEIGPGVGAAAPLLIPDPIDYQADAESHLAAEAPTVSAAESTGEPALVAPQVSGPRLAAERLNIRRVFAEPAEDGKSPGSLLVVVEALNATDEPVDAIGAASLMIMVQDAPGSLKRIERWDFTAEETAAAWQSSNLGDGLHLELPLAKGELPDGELELWARVVNDDGAKLLTPPDQAYRFEANQLASMEDAAEETVLAATEQPDAAPKAAKQPPAAKSAPAEVASTAAAPRPQWRASAVRLNQDRVEGFATTASGQGSRGGWTTRPIDAAQPRVAAATTPSKGDRPTWKRSSTAAAGTGSSPEWSANR